MKQVIIIDDSLIVQNQLKDFLEKECNFKVVGLGSDGVQAVSLYEKHQPDLITLDITMPNKDGLAALKEILEKDPAAKVIMISVISDSRKILEAMKIGAKGYIEKPLDFNSPEYVNQVKEEIDFVVT